MWLHVVCHNASVSPPVIFHPPFHPNASLALPCQGLPQLKAMTYIALHVPSVLLLLLLAQLLSVCQPQPK